MSLEQKSCLAPRVYRVLFTSLLVPDPVYRMTKLKRLDLSHNKITELSTLIGKSFSELTNLVCKIFLKIACLCYQLYQKSVPKLEMVIGSR